MKKMRVVIGVMMLVAMLALVGCNSEAKQNEEDAERIGAIEEKVYAMLNEDKDDIVEGLKEEQIEEVEALLKEEEGKEFSEENGLRIGSITLYMNDVNNMFNTQSKIEKLAEDDELEADKVEETREMLEVLKENKPFYERQNPVLEEVEENLEKQVAQVKHVEKTKKALDKLFKKDKVKKDVTKKEYDSVKKLVKKIEDKETKEDLNKKLKSVDKKLKQIAKKEKEEKEEKERQLAEQKAQEEKAKQESKTKENSNVANNKSNKSQSQSQSKQSSSSKQSSNNSSSDNKSNSSSNNSNPSNNSNKGDQGNNNSNGGGMSGQDIADWINNGDCVQTGSGEIDEGGNTWNGYSCK